MEIVTLCLTVSHDTVLKNLITSLWFICATTAGLHKT